MDSYEVTMNKPVSLLNQAIERITSRMSILAPFRNPKHDHYTDFGWPREVGFNDFYRMYMRNSVASAAVDKTVEKTWETDPVLCETEVPKSTPRELEIEKHFRRIRLWRTLKEVDTRSLVGRYAGAILLIADDLPLDQPVGKVSGVEGLAGVVPAWEGSLKAGDAIRDRKDPMFGRPEFYHFTEQVEGTMNMQSIKIHHTRVIIWSDDGTMSGKSSLNSGYNDLLDMEKVKGAGGEGFWKTSRGAPIIEAPEGVSPAQVAKSMGTDQKGLLDAINDQLNNFQQGFDKGLMLGGMTAKPLTISLPNPDPFFNINIMSFAASWRIPIRILIGNQTGERASTEDNKEWSKAMDGRRNSYVIPLLNELVDRLMAFGILEHRDWFIYWQPLTESTSEEKLAKASKMSEINQRTVAGDEPAFYPDEIREAAGYPSLSEVAGDHERRVMDDDEDPLGDDPPEKQPKEGDDEQT